MSTILDQLAEYALRRTEEAKRKKPLAAVREEAERLPKNADVFEKALRARGDSIALICECKKASPSKGMIAEEFPYVDIALAYEKGGADCLSVLTEPKWFLGSGRYLKEIADAVQIPVLRKDFTVDEYMIYEAKTLGASAVLLICAILTPAQLREYMEAAHALGLTALVEVHDEQEMETAGSAGARVIGVNNRNLHDFSVDVETSARLRNQAPEGALFVAESGISGPEDMRALRKMGAGAALVGEALMRAEDKGAAIAALRNAARED